MAGEVVVFVVVQAACGPGWWAWRRLRARKAERPPPPGRGPLDAGGRDAGADPLPTAEQIGYCVDAVDGLHYTP